MREKPPALAGFILGVCHLIVAVPISLQRVPILLESAIFAPCSAQTGRLSLSVILFFSRLVTTPAVVAEFTFNIKGSPFLIGSTFNSSFDPTTCCKSFGSILRSVQMGGSLPGCPTSVPDSWSDFTIEGSSSVMRAMDPPGCASSTLFPPVLMSRILLLRVIHFSTPFSVIGLPGEISTCSPFLRMPCLSAPPRTPPESSLMLVPGLLMSKERATSMSGSLVGSLLGVGICSSMALKMRLMLML